MTARVLVVAALVVLLAGCGGAHQAAPPPATTLAKPPPMPQPKHRQTHRAGELTKLVVTILDGDQRVRVHGARVRLAGKTGRTNRHGVTVIKAPRGRIPVTVAARGYAPVTQRVNFLHSRRQTVDIFQPALQWPLYGATEARTQAPSEIHLHPPFRLVWSRGLGHLIEFPAVVVDGMAYIGNAAATVHAISMRDGNFAWVHRTPGSPRMASSPAVYKNEIVYHTMSGWVYVL
ncbi:MAG TPA: PQQ-binding-like beta-propeller repeat protein, partial [Gaiellaceae bacterium]|nr:PQQ-binding-like beta-propeller repeat protein [Gaiellaceae bacterium]